MVWRIEQLWLPRESAQQLFLCVSECSVIGFSRERKANLLDIKAAQRLLWRSQLSSLIDLLMKQAGGYYKLQ